MLVTGTIDGVIESSKRGKGMFVSFEWIESRKKNVSFDQQYEAESENEAVTMKKPGFDQLHRYSLL